MNHALAIAGCKKGDKQAQKNLFEFYSKSLLYLCKRYVSNNHDAEDMLLKGFYKFFATIHQFEYIDDISLCAWLKKIMVNECLMFLRRDSKLRFAEDAVNVDVTLNEDVLESMHAKAIISMINTLPDGYRIVFNLFVVEGYTHNEIAQMLGISVGTSKSQLMRSKIYLQKLLKEKGIVYETR